MSLWSEEGSPAPCTLIEKYADRRRETDFVEKLVYISITYNYDCDG
jgi:hypothetical protein